MLTKLFIKYITFYFLIWLKYRPPGNLTCFETWLAYRPPGRPPAWDKKEVAYFPSSLYNTHGDLDLDQEESFNEVSTERQVS
jgi:hypothetical protein